MCEAGGSGSEELNEMPSPSPCSPLIGECSWKKTHIEKKIVFISFCYNSCSGKKKVNLKECVAAIALLL